MQCGKSNIYLTNVSTIIIVYNESDGLVALAAILVTWHIIAFSLMKLVE